MGSGSFPFDMLRYDHAFPASELDSGRMIDKDHRQVRLSTHSAHGGSEASKLRWASFGWTVI